MNSRKWASYLLTLSIVSVFIVLVLLNLYEFIWYSIVIILVVIPLYVAIIYILRIPLRILENKFYRAVVSKPIFHATIFRYLESETEIDIERSLINKDYHKLAHVDFEYLKLILKLLHENPSVFKDFSPYGRELIKKAVESKYLQPALEDFINYYSESLDFLIKKQIQRHPIEEKKLQRIIYEHTQEQKKFLEQKLPPRDPILVKIQEATQIQVNSEFSILK